LYQRVKSEIAANFRDPELTPSRLSKPFGETLRTIQLVFQKEHETVSNVINRYRLNAFQFELEQSLRRGQKPKISQLAYNSGFNDVSYFNRRYKEAKGMSPRQYINQIKETCKPC
jgi:AraC-like DNA-binding protein